jgi:uncharacterized protein YutE (UPF0331/DUF86 family)
MTIDQEVVATRLTLMRALLADLDELGVVAPDRLVRERITRHAVERILGQLVDLATGINAHVVTTLRGFAPASYRDSFVAMADVGVLPRELADRLAPSAGMRNILAHEYVAIDPAVVALAVPSARTDYGDYVRVVARWLLSQE